MIRVQEADCRDGGWDEIHDRHAEEDARRMAELDQAINKPVRPSEPQPVKNEPRKRKVVIGRSYDHKVVEAIRSYGPRPVCVRCTKCGKRLYVSESSLLLHCKGGHRCEKKPKKKKASAPRVVGSKIGGYTVVKYYPCRKKWLLRCAHGHEVWRRRDQLAHVDACPECRVRSSDPGSY